MERLVAKYIGYETAPAAGLWRYRERCSWPTTPTPQAVRAALADQAAALLPSSMRHERDITRPVRPPPTGREPQPVRAFERTVAALGSGPGLATYIGHASYWQWASTDPTAQPPYLLGLYDADGLANGEQPAIVLNMTCLTAAFQTPAVSGTTIDERMLLAAGGAVAVWGPTGLGVAHGHDALQRGFHTALWRAPAMEARLGALANAGYLDLYAASSCCQDALRTFALLGDPLTPARVRSSPVRFLPSIRRK